MGRCDGDKPSESSPSTHLASDLVDFLNRAWTQFHAVGEWYFLQYPMNQKNIGAYVKPLAPSSCWVIERCVGPLKVPPH
jgi:hypothetical protein